MVLTAIGLIVLGLAVGLFGYSLFRVLLPVAGLVVGAVIGFTGVQGIFGTGVASTTVAVVVAALFAVVMAALSYLFFDIAVIVYAGAVFASLFTLLGVGLGLSANGFVLTLLAVAGFILGIMLASSSGLFTQGLVMLITGFVGTGFILGGVFLLTGGVTTQMLQEQGVISSVASQVNQSFLWVLVWITGAMVFRYIQMGTYLYQVFPEHLSYETKS